MMIESVDCGLSRQSPIVNLDRHSSVSQNRYSPLAIPQSASLHRDIASSAADGQRGPATLDWTSRAMFGTSRGHLEHPLRHGDRAVTRDRVELITCRRWSDLDGIAALAVDRERGWAVDRDVNIRASDVEPSFGSKPFYFQ